MALGLGVLKLSPRDFWAMTPAELAAAARGLNGRAGGPAPLGRSEFERLMARFPDMETTDG